MYFARFKTAYIRKIKTLKYQEPLEEQLNRRVSSPIRRKLFELTITDVSYESRI
jgi:hypothetical protein